MTPIVVVSTMGRVPLSSRTARGIVRLEHDSATGQIAVYVDGAQTPALTAVDRTIEGGGAGFGSFEDTGLIREIVVRGGLVPGLSR
jgi:hypothetical protein